MDFFDPISLDQGGDRWISIFLL